MLGSVAITSCSHPKTMSPEELRSTLTEAVSIASESEMFIDYALQKRTTRNYASAHLEYLLEQASQAAKETHESVADAQTQQVKAVCEEQLDRLVQSLSFAHRELDDTDKLRIAKQRIDNARSALDKAKSSL